jgi:hypothetical protein
MRWRERKKERNGGAHIWRGKWRASRIGGWEGEFGGVCKMEACLEALLEMDFCTKPPNFALEAHMETPLEMLLQMGHPFVQSFRRLQGAAGCHESINSG